MKPAPADVRALARRDPALGAALRRMPKFPSFPLTRGPARTQSHFHAIARAVVYQQLSGKAARTIHDRVQALTPGRLFPRAEELLALSDRQLRGAGLSRAKTAALRDLAGRVGSGELRLGGLSRLSDEAVIERLVPVRGIGVWSAQMFLLFRLGRLDVMPTADLGVQRGLQRLDGLEALPGPAELLARSDPWRPLRSVASWVLWRLSDGPAPRK